MVETQRRRDSWIVDDGDVDTVPVRAVRPPTRLHRLRESSTPHSLLVGRPPTRCAGTRHDSCCATASAIRRVTEGERRISAVRRPARGGTDSDLGVTRRTSSTKTGALRGGQFKSFEQRREMHGPHVARGHRGNEVDQPSRCLLALDVTPRQNHAAASGCVGD